MPTLWENIASFFNLNSSSSPLESAEQAPADLKDTLDACVYAMMSFFRVLSCPFEYILSEEINTVIKRLNYGSNMHGEELSRELNAAADALNPADEQDWADLPAQKEEALAVIYFNNAEFKNNFSKLLALSGYIAPKKQYGAFVNGLLENKGNEEISMLFSFLQTENRLYRIFHGVHDESVRFGEKLHKTSIELISRIIENLSDFQKELIRKYGLSRSIFFSPEKASSFYTFTSIKNEDSLIKKLAKAEERFNSWTPYFLFEAIAARRAGLFAAARQYIEKFENAKKIPLKLNYYSAAAVREKILLADDETEIKNYLAEIENNCTREDGNNLLFCTLLHYLTGNTSKGDEILYSQKPLPHILKNTLKSIFKGKERHISLYETLKEKAENGDVKSSYHIGKTLLFCGQEEESLPFFQKAGNEGQSSAFVQILTSIRENDRLEILPVETFLSESKTNKEAAYVLWLLLCRNKLKETAAQDAEAILLDYAEKNDPVIQALFADFLIKQKRFKEGREWAEHSAKAGYYVGQYIAAELFTKAKETKQSREKALYYYAVAAQSGFPNILYVYAKYILSGKPDKYAGEYADDLLNESLSLGYAKAREELMKVCLENNVLSESRERGAKFAFELVEEGNAEAMYYAALCYRDGIGTEKNELRADELFRKGSELGENNCLFFSAKRQWEEAKSGEEKERARALMISLSNKGSSSAQAFLGEKYLFEENSIKNTADGISLLKKAMEKGNSDAELTLAFCYMSGRGVTTDQQHAAALIKQSAKHGNAEAQFFLDSIIACDLSKFKQKYEDVQAGESLSEEFRAMLADEAYKKKNISELEAMSEDGDSRAVLEIGMRELDAYGAAEGKTARIIEAAEKGNIFAQYLGGNIYSAGIGVIADANKALELYKKSAEQGLPDALCVLGSFLLQGRGVEADPKKAEQYFKKAAVKGLASAQIALASMKFHGIGVEKDTKTAAYWYREAAKKEVTEGEGNLGICYVHGEGVPRNETIGAKWLYKAAVKGFAPAQTSLGILFLNGIGIPKNEGVAVELLQYASLQNDPAAQFYLGACYSRGIAVQANQNKAVSLCLKSAENGFPLAQYQIGYYYENSGFFARNMQKAVFWYSKAALQGIKEAEERLKDMGIDIEQLK